MAINQITKSTTHWLLITFVSSCIGFTLFVILAFSSIGVWFMFQKINGYHLYQLSECQSKLPQ